MKQASIETYPLSGKTLYIPDYNSVREFMDFGSHDEFDTAHHPEFGAIHDISLEEA